MIQLEMGDGGMLPARIARLIEKVETAWAEFHASYDGLADEELLIPGVCGEWSVRDLVAHVTWWDEEALNHLPTVLEGESPPRYSMLYGGIDAFNAMKTEEKRGLSLEEVRCEADETHRRLLAYLRGIPVERLKGNSRFTHRLRLDTYGHYPIHTDDIRRWRERRIAD
ncbi:MAG TPA: maleylpyruvate isomerase N-terminal domain-containing protein [Thermomicrobiales bacterium]|nr:maleylpyruvate isomerase N-terminal domain-containing protein [Thermomicrobiales bacterium]